MGSSNTALLKTIPLGNASTAKKWSTKISIGLVVVGCLVLLGWMLNISVLKNILPDLASMKPNSAIAFVLVGLALWFIATGRSRTSYRLPQILALLVFLIGLLTLSEYLFGWDLGIDQFLFQNTASTTIKIRMAEATAFGFTLLGLALLLLIDARRYILTQIFALIVFGIGLLAFVGYIFSANALYREALFNTIALPTALALCASGLGILLASSEKGFIAVISQNHLGGLMARRMLPAVFSVLLVMGWLRLQGQHLGYYETEFGTALFAVSAIIILTIVVWWTARLLNRIDTQHQEATRQLELYGRRMEILHNIDQGIIAAQALPQVIETTIKELRKLIPCERVAFSLVDEILQNLDIFTVDTNLDNPFNTERLPLQPNFFDGFNDHNTRLFEDLRLVQGSFQFADNLIERGFLTLFQVKITRNGLPVGIVHLAATTVGFFTKEYREIAVEVTTQLGIVIKQMRLSDSIQRSNETLERYARRMEILHKIDQGIIASYAIPELIETTLKDLRVLIPCERIAVSLVDEPARELMIFAADTDRESPFDVVRMPLAPQMFEDYGADNMRLFEDMRLVQERYPFTTNLVKQGFLTLLQVLLMQDGLPIGFMSFSAVSVGFFTSEFREIALEVANQLSIVIKQMRLSDALRQANDTLEQRVIERTAELNAAKDQVEAILNNSLDGILLANIDLGIEKANPAFEKLFGHTIADRAALSLLDVIDAADARRVRESIQTALMGVRNNTLEVRGRRENGTTFDAELSIGHIEGDGLVSTIHDITNRKVQERQLHYNASIQNTVADAVIVTDLDFRIQSWNKAAERIYGWPADEVIGKPVRDILRTEFNSTQFGEEIQRVFIEDGHWTGEVIQHRRDGSTIYMLSSTVLFKDVTGNPFGILAINHDISERIQAENMLRGALEHERELGDMKTRFISVASHEFRTPLTAILLATESLKFYRHKLTPDQIDQKLEKIALQVSHMTSILEDVLQSARMQDNYVDFKPAQEKFEVVCSDIVEEFTERQEYEGRIHYTSEIPELMSSFDSRLVRQIVINLLSNALKYSAADKPVHIKLFQQDQQITLVVSDQGIGIPAEDLKNIFEPFHRAKNVGRISGTGLGMSITKKAVEMHNGTINVLSEVNQGTTFTVNIPITEA